MHGAHSEKREAGNCHGVQYVYKGQGIDAAMDGYLSPLCSKQLEAEGMCLGQ